MGLELFAKLIQIVATERDDDKALMRLAEGAMALVPSRLAMFAVLNDELGVMEIRHGAGEEFPQVMSGQVTIDVGGEHGIVSHVAAIGKTYRTGNVHLEPRYRKLFQSTESEISSPVFDKFGRLRAVVNFESDQLNAYREEHEPLVEAVAALVSVVLDREEASHREDALIEIGAALEVSFSEEELIERVLGVARDVLRLQACSLFLLDPSDNTFVLRGSTSSLASKVGEIRYQSNEGLTGWVCSNGQTLMVQNPQNDPRWRGLYVEVPSEEIASFLAAPFLERGKSIGCLRAIRRVSENKLLDNRFTPSDQLVLEAVADQFATGLAAIRGLGKIVHSERMAAWGELSARSSHMIGNRVFALKGDVNELGYLLKSDQLDKKDLLDLQDSLTRNVGRIEEILQEFRDFLTATQIKHEEVDMNALIRETLDEVFPKMGPHKLVLELSDEAPKIKGDAPKLRRAVSELVENSLHHMEEGALTVRSKAHAGKGGKRWFQFEIQDEGPGVESERKQQIFQPFHTSRVKGMGLGLSIVKGIVDAHGGQVFEDGKPGQGATFIIRLPE